MKLINIHVHTLTPAELEELTLREKLMKDSEALANAGRAQFADFWVNLVPQFDLTVETNTDLYLAKTLDGDVCVVRKSEPKNV